MTTIEKLKQALDALECMSGDAWDTGGESRGQMVDSAVTNLQVIISEFENAEPVGKFAQDKYGIWYMLPIGTTQGEALYTHLVPAAPEVCTAAETYANLVYITSKG